MDSGRGIGVHAQTVTPMEHHVAQTAVEVFVNAVKAHGDGVLRIEQQGKEVWLADRPRVTLREVTQARVEPPVESRVIRHVHRGTVEALPAESEFVRRIHISSLFAFLARRDARTRLYRSLVYLT